MLTILGLSILTIIGLIGAFYMAWNIGANDLANSMGDVVGAKVLTLRQVCIAGGIMNFLGVVLYGSRVTKTVGKGIVQTDRLMEIDPHMAVLGAIAALFAAGIWVSIATFKQLPVSTSHSMVGSMLGFGIAAASMGIIGFDDIGWVVLMKVAASWILSPFAGLILAFLIFNLIRHTLINRVEDTSRLEKIFGPLLVASSCYQAFSFGSNDVANAIGPVPIILGIENLEIPLWLLVFGGIGIVIGLSTWGYKVIYTIGERITELTPTRGFSSDVACATVVIACSSFGMPVSTTHVLVGCTIGVGLARGLEAVNLNVIKKIVYSWLVTVPISMIIASAIFLGLVGLGI